MAHEGRSASVGVKVLALTLHQKTRQLELVFALPDGSEEVGSIALELLRVRSPSAQVRGHGSGQETVQVGKSEVSVSSIDAVGLYGIQPRFSDGHDSGIYSWDYLYDLAKRPQAHWQEHDAILQRFGVSRDGQPLSNDQ